PGVLLRVRAAEGGDHRAADLRALRGGAHEGPAVRCADPRRPRAGGDGRAGDGARAHRPAGVGASEVRANGCRTASVKAAPRTPARAAPRGCASGWWTAGRAANRAGT